MPSQTTATALGIRAGLTSSSQLDLDLESSIRLDQLQDLLEVARSRRRADHEEQDNVDRIAALLTLAGPKRFLLARSTHERGWSNLTIPSLGYLPISRPEWCKSM